MPIDALDTIHLRTLLDSMAEGIFIIGRDWRYKFVNRRFAQALRVDATDLLGRQLLDVLPALETTSFYQAYQTTMETGEPGQTVDGFTLPDGRTGIFEVSSYAVPDGILCIARDLTDLEEAERHVRQTERRFEALFNALAIGVVELAPDREITHANPAAEQILGMPRSAIEGLHYHAAEWDLVREDHSPMPYAELATSVAFATKQEYRNIMGVRRPQGVLWLSVTSAPIIDRHGQPQGMVTTFADITGRKQEHEALEKSEARYKGALDAIRILAGQPQPTPEPPQNALTQREREVLCLVAKGFTNAQIAVELSISEKTVASRLGNVYEKLGITNRVQATLYALRQGLVNLTE